MEEALTLKTDIERIDEKLKKIEALLARYEPETHARGGNCNAPPQVSNPREGDLKAAVRAFLMEYSAARERQVVRSHLAHERQMRQLHELWKRFWLSIWNDRKLYEP